MFRLTVSFRDQSIRRVNQYKKPTCNLNLHKLRWFFDGEIVLGVCKMNVVHHFEYLWTLSQMLGHNIKYSYYRLSETLGFVDHFSGGIL